MKTGALRLNRPLRSHELSELAALAEVELPAQLLGLQTYAVEARYEEGPKAVNRSD
jgi:hypothetical protein